MYVSFLTTHGFRKTPGPFGGSTLVSRVGNGVFFLQSHKTLLLTSILSSSRTTFLDISRPDSHLVSHQELSKDASDVTSDLV